jgi:hypothetical protein
MAIASIIQRVALALVLVFSGIPMAQADVRVHNTKDLSQDKGVEHIARVALALVAAGVVYDQCSTELGITDEQKKSLDTRYAHATDAYVQAYHDAYVKLVGYPPDPQTVADYTNHIQKLYQQAAVNTASAIASRRGCFNSSVRSITRYVDKVEKEEAAEKAAAAAEE